MTSEHPVVQLGRLLSGTEAAQLATMFEADETLSQALQVIGAGRRASVRNALEKAGVVPGADGASAVLRAVQGAATRQRAVSPVWTLPGYLADYGDLTTSLKDLVLSAKTSVMCSTYNFQKSSQLWEALNEVAKRGTVDLRIYLDTGATRNAGPTTPTFDEIANQLPDAKIFRTHHLDKRRVVNHAKFVVVDHRFVVVTSANFSVSAELHNVELGLRVDDSALAELIEEQMIDNEKRLYRSVHH